MTYYLKAFEMCIMSFPFACNFTKPEGSSFNHGQ